MAADVARLLKNHVNIRACPPYVRGRGGMIHEIMHNHGQRPYGLSISMLYFSLAFVETLVFEGRRQDRWGWACLPASCCS